MAQEVASEAAEGALAAPRIDYTMWTLANGLRVIALEDHSTATVTTSLWYDVGSKNDPEGRSGFAHLFEHILSRKTVNMPYNMINALADDVGGTRNASTGDDRTNYFETVPAEYLETMLWTHRERMALPVVDEEVFETERGVVKEELRTRVLAPPYGRFIRFVIPENAYDTLPQRRPGIGSIAELDAATLEDARAFHQAYYGPDTATLIVAGNFEMEKLRALVDQYFADIPPRADPVPVAVTQRDAPRTAPRVVAAHGPTVPLPVVGSLWQLPGAGDPDSAALEVLNAVLGRGLNSRLQAAFITSGLAVDKSQALSFSEEAGFLVSFLLVNPDADKPAIAALLADEIARVREQEITPAELTEAVNELVADSLRQRETVRGRAFELGEALMATGDPEAADRRLRAIAGVSAADVQRVAQQYLRPEARVDLVYERGEADPDEYANPVPMPRFASLPPATGEPREVLPEGERQAPPGPGAKPAVANPALARETFGNGMQVIAAQTGAVPIATMVVYFPGGSASVPRDKAGLAELAASLANRGTPTRSAEEIAARLESLGADFSAFARTDGTVLSLTAPTANLAAAGEVFADILRNANYPDDEFERERGNAIDAFAIQLSDPAELASMALRPVLYGAAPYGTIGSGTPESLATLTREELAAYRQEYWIAGAARVIVTGGIAPERAFAVTQALFGDWSAEAPPPPALVEPAGPVQPVRTLVIDLPDAGQAAVYLGGRGPERADADYFPLELANSVLGGGSTGRLFVEIRNKRALSYGSYSSLGSLADDPLLIASTQTANETVPEVVRVMLGEFTRIGSEPLDEDLLARRRAYLEGGYARDLETSSGFASALVDLLAQGVDPAQAATYAASLDAVTAGQASTAAARYFDPSGISLVVVGNAEAFIDDLRAIRPDVEVIPAEGIDLLSL